MIVQSKLSHKIYLLIETIVLIKMKENHIFLTFHFTAFYFYTHLHDSVSVVNFVYSPQECIMKKLFY